MNVIELFESMCKFEYIITIVLSISCVYLYDLQNSIHEIIIKLQEERLSRKIDTLHNNEKIENSINKLSDNLYTTQMNLYDELLSYNDKIETLEKNLNRAIDDEINNLDKKYEKLLETNTIQ
jgi:hypothetical protein